MNISTPDLRVYIYPSRDVRIKFYPDETWNGRVLEEFEMPVDLPSKIWESLYIAIVAKSQYSYRFCRGACMLAITVNNERVLFEKSYMRGAGVVDVSRNVIGLRCEGVFKAILLITASRERWQLVGPAIA